MGRRPFRPPDTERTLRFDDHDRRRLALASVLTIVALPAVWLVNQEDDGAVGSRPNVAAVGLPAEAAVASTLVVSGPIDPMGNVDAQYLDGSPLAGPSPQPAPMVIGSSDDALVATAEAIYRASVGRIDTCEFNGAGAGELIIVVNVDNGRSVECWTALRPPDAPEGELVMHPDRFREIADPTSAPIDVEIRQ